MTLPIYVGQLYNLRVWPTFNSGSVYTWIKFTLEEQEGDSFPFLDVKIIVNDDDTIGTTVYRKKTHTNLYPSQSSFSDHKTKSAFIKSSTRRALMYCSDESLLNEEIELVENVAVANGWDREVARGIIKDTERKVKEEHESKLIDPVQFETAKAQKRSEWWDKPKCIVPFPGEGMAGQIRRICRKYGVNPIFKSNGSIKSHLSKLKDKTDIMDKAGVVYNIPLNCEKVYIGETSGVFRVRFGQHQDYIRKDQVGKSAILEHLQVCQNVCQKGKPGVKWDEVSILGRETFKGTRLALESLEIKLNGDNINRNKGQPEISEIWDSAISNFGNRKGFVRKGRPGQRERYERARDFLDGVT